MPGRIACDECAFERTDRFGAVHSIDLHWRFNNNWMLAGAVGFEELWGIRVPLRALGSHTWTRTNLFALLIACVHCGAQLKEVAYEIGDFYRISSESTLWFYDIHMLSELLSDSERVSWSVIVINRGFSEFAISGLERSCLLFGMKVPEWVLSDLRKAPDQFSINSLDS
ncbi:nucleotidyltransferase family protein [Gammaproteobacteria bacterium]|nr:nucleotidyltransferase family protein [Gammaproteobacteria bacterium]